VCLVAPARVIALEGTAAVVDDRGRRRRASLLLEPGTRVGDWVLLGSGTVLRRLDPIEAEGILETIRAAEHGDAQPMGGFR